MPSASRAARSNGVSGKGTRSRMRVSSATVGITQTLDERPRDRRADRGHEMQPERGEEGRQDGHLDDYPPLAADAGHALDHLAVGHDLGTAEVVALADSLLSPGDRRRGTARCRRARSAASGSRPSVGRPSPGGDRPRRRWSRTLRCPCRRRPPPAASSAARRRTRVPGRSRACSGGAARAPRPPRRAHRGRRSGGRRRSQPRRPSSAPPATSRSSKSARAERVNEVVDDVRALERPPDRRRVGDVGDHPGDALLRRLWAPGDRDDLVFGREGRRGARGR